MKNNTSFHRHLSVQIGLTVAVVTSLSFGFTIWFVVSEQRETLTRELTQRSLSESRNLSLAAAGPLLRRDPELGLHTLITRAISEMPDLVELTVLDSHGIIQGHQDVLQVGTRRRISRVKLPINLTLRPGEKTWINEQGNLIIRQPIHQLNQRIGQLTMEVTRDAVEATIQKAQNKLLLMAGIGTLSSIFIVVFMVSLNLRALGALRRGVQKLGSGDLSARVIVGSKNELGMFANLVNSMAAGLEKAQSKLIQKERMDHELQIARELQSMLLPKSVKPSPGYQMQAHYSPALEVSGDYYDSFPLDADHVAIIAADVSGKGVPGLVVMAMLRTSLRSLASAQLNPIEVLVGASRHLQGSMGRGMFITAVYGVLNTRTHAFTYVSAGHCPILFFGNQTVRYLPAGGKPIGLFPEPIFRKSLTCNQVSLQPGDSLLLYTDGLVESLNSRGEQLGSESVTRCITRWQKNPRGNVIDVLLGLVESHRVNQPPSDDLTLVAVQRQSAGVSSTTEISR